MSAAMPCPSCGKADAFSARPKSGDQCEACGLTTVVPVGCLAPTEHSVAGVISFVIALLVGALNLLILLVAVASPTAPKHPLAIAALSLLVSLSCFSVLSAPLCVAGFAMSLVTLIHHKGRNHIFSWLGLYGNLFILCMMMLALIFTSLLGNLRRQERMNHCPSVLRNGFAGKSNVDGADGSRYHKSHRVM